MWLASFLEQEMIEINPRIRIGIAFFIFPSATGIIRAKYHHPQNALAAFKNDFPERELIMRDLAASTRLINNLSSHLFSPHFPAIDQMTDR